jgi:cell division protein FtsW
VERVERERGDFILILILVLMAGVGMSLLFSASYPFSSRAYRDPFYLVKRQLVFMSVGAFAGIVLFLTPPVLIRKRVPLILAATMIFSLLPFLPGLGVTVLGSRRWVRLFGVSFQPSELMKLSLVLYLASYYGKEGRERTLNELARPFIVTVLFAAVIYVQNDYSTAVFVLVVGMAMFFVARVRLLYFALLSLFALPVSFLMLFLREHRVQRLLAFLDLSADRSGSGWQIANSQSAFVAGALWGKGLGGSTAKLGSLPMSHSDFIFAVVAEETGVLGVLFVIALFALFAWRGYSIALESRDPFARYLAFGVTTTIVLQALLNMTVAVGLVPTTGVTLPFFSAGGSSLAVTLAMCGLLANVSRRVDRAAEWRGGNV